MFTRRRVIADEALPLAREIGDPKLLAAALCAFAIVIGGDAMTMLEESRSLAIASGDQATLAMVLASMGHRDRERGDALQREALDLYRKLGDRAGIARLLFTLAIWADAADKRTYLEEALELKRQLGAKKRIYEILTLLEHCCDPLDWISAKPMRWSPGPGPPVRHFRLAGGMPGPSGRDRNVAGDVPGRTH